MIKNNLPLAAIVCLFVLRVSPVFPQSFDTEKSINENRKGVLTIVAKPGSKVMVEQLSHEFWFGCAITNSAFNGSWNDKEKTMYEKKFLENFNAAVTENAVKWGNMEPDRGKVNYGVVDAILDWTEDNNIPLRAHNLFWGIPKYVQPWLKDLPDKQLELALRNRAETITSRYKGRFAEYDLNNEMIHGNYYEERLGPDITMKMAAWARNGDPDIRLFLNDYDILTGNKLPEYLTHIRKLLSQGVPIAGIGVQGHLHGDTFNREKLKNALDSLAQFGLPIRITEFNIPGQRSEAYKERKAELTQEEEENKAKELEDYYRICFAHPAVQGILMWGFWEGANWIPASSLYKRDWTPTPAATAYQNLIFKEWWTKEKDVTDQRGELSIPAFYGKYRITVNGESKEFVFPKSERNKKIHFE